MSERVSIIIPVFNQKKDYLVRCFESAIGQDYEDIEIIIVDDDSTDDTLEFCRKLCEGHERCKVLHQEHKRQGGARNTGVAAATGQYIFFLDSDDWVEKNTISRLHALIKEYHAQIAVCGCFKQNEKGEVFREAREEEIVVLDRFHALESYVFDTAYCNHSPCDKLYDIKLFAGEQFVENSYYEDLGSVYKFVRHADTVVYTNEQLYCYFDNLSSTMHKPFSEHEFDKIKWYHAISEYFFETDRRLYRSFIREMDRQTVYCAIGFVYKARQVPATEKLAEKIKDTRAICKKIKSRIGFRLNLLRKLIVFSPALFCKVWKVYQKRQER